MLTQNKKHKLSIYLIKEEYRNDEDFLPKLKKMKSYKIKDKKDFLGTLYIQTGYKTIPKWADFFKDIFSPEEIGLKSISSRAILIVNIKKRNFCLTFGHAHFLILPMAIQRNFGLKMALNLGGSSSLRAVDKTSLDVVEIQSREQSSKEVTITNFDFDFETDILKSITTKSEETSETITGRDSVNINTIISINSLRDFLENYFSIYNSESYKEKFPWVDNISEVRDRGIIEKLNKILIKNISEIKHSKVWFAIPEIINWEDISGFAYKKRKIPAVSPDIHIRNWLDEIGTDRKITLELLKSRNIIVYDNNYDLYRQWPVYRCINAEIDFNKKKFILNDACWYAVNNDFVTDIQKFYNSIPESQISLPSFDHKIEPTYNIFVAKNYSKKFFLMDKKNIPIGGGRSSVEFCDLYGKNNKIIHIKRYGGSSVLSHLFQQGVVSGLSFLADANFRIKLNKKLSDEFKIKNPRQRPTPQKYEICFAIMSDVPGVLNIPFFSKVVMKNAVKELQNYGYHVTKKKVDQF